MSRKTNALHVITPVFNPMQYKTRYALYNAFAKRMAHQNVNLYTVEIAHDEHPFHITDPDNKQHIRLRTRSTMWHKENALNVALQYLPKDWKFVAFVDCDVEFVSDTWVERTLKALEQFPFIQPFHFALEIDPDGNPFNLYTSFCWNYLKAAKLSRIRGFKTVGQLTRTPGFASCFRRKELEQVGGLPSIYISGGGDRVITNALVQDPALINPPIGETPGIVEYVKKYNEQVLKVYAKKIGYIEGSLLTHWHGNKVLRQYSERHAILNRHKYDPDTDLYVNKDGLYEFYQDEERQRSMHAQLRNYFANRNEDSVEICNADISIHRITLPGMEKEETK